MSDNPKDDDEPKSKSKSGLSTGATAGIVIAVLAIITIGLYSKFFTKPTALKRPPQEAGWYRAAVSKNSLNSIKGAEFSKMSDDAYAREAKLNAERLKAIAHSRSVARDKLLGDREALRLRAEASNVARKARMTPSQLENINKLGNREALRLRADEAKLKRAAREAAREASLNYRSYIADTPYVSHGAYYENV